MAGRPKTYPPEQIEWLSRNLARWSWDALAGAFSQRFDTETSAAQLRVMARKHRLRKPPRMPPAHARSPIRRWRSIHAPIHDLVAELRQTWLA